MDLSFIKIFGCVSIFNKYWNDPFKIDSLMKSRLDDLEKMKECGDLLLRVEEREVNEAVKWSTLCALTSPSGIHYTVRFVMCKHTLASEVGNRLSSMDDCNFAAIGRYNYDTDEWLISCRAKDKVNLAVLCREFGGHPNAAGFTLKNDKNALQNLFRKN